MIVLFLLASFLALTRADFDADTCSGKSYSDLDFSDSDGVRKAIRVRSNSTNWPFPVVVAYLPTGNDTRRRGEIDAIPRGETHYLIAHTLMTSLIPIVREDYKYKSCMNSTNKEDYYGKIHIYGYEFVQCESLAVPIKINDCPAGIQCGLIDNGDACYFRDKECHCIAPDGNDTAAPKIIPMNSDMEIDMYFSLSPHRWERWQEELKKYDVEIIDVDFGLKDSKALMSTSGPSVTTVAETTLTTHEDGSSSYSTTTAVGTDTIDTTPTVIVPNTPETRVESPPPNQNPSSSASSHNLRMKLSCRDCKNLEVNLESILS